MMLAAALLAFPVIAQEGAGVPGRVDPSSGPDERAIRAGIARGVEFLLRSQNRDGSWTTESTASDRTMDLRNAQTAFSAYTLLKCRVDAQQPAIRRALAHLAGAAPVTTYANGVELMFYEALNDSQQYARMQRDLDVLLDIRSEKGWGYTEQRSRSDPSNVQYALLGLSAAARAGLKVPREIWSESIEGLLRFQEAPVATVRTGARDVDPAGFHYADGEKKPSGSMTATGICVLALCEEMLAGKVPRDLAADFARSKAAALAWLADHFAVDTNPGGNDAWKFYYLYSVERAANMLHLDRIGTHAWYRMGATELLRTQERDGSWSTAGGKTEWPPRPMVNANTCFALLFLAQSTRVASGPSAGHEFDGWISEDPDTDVGVRARSQGRLVAGVSTLSPAICATLGANSARDVLVRSVEWTVDGVVVARLSVQAGAPFDADVFVLRHAFATNGEHTVSACVSALAPGDPQGEPTVLRSKPLTVRIRDVLEPWMLTYAEGESSLIAEKNVESVTATSQYDVYTPAWRALDGLEFHGWVCKADDPAPQLTIELEKPVRAKAIVLTQPNACERDADLYGRVTRVRLTCNDEPRFVEIEVDPDPLKKTVHAFAKPFMARKLELAIVERTSGRNGSAAGFAEIVLRAP